MEGMIVCPNNPQVCVVSMIKLQVWKIVVWLNCLVCGCSENYNAKNLLNLSLCLLSPTFKKIYFRSEKNILCVASLRKKGVKCA